MAVDHGAADGGLTPAQAGTAILTAGLSSWHGAHPRAGGDGHDPATFTVGAVGSPPRRRGRHIAGADVPAGLGLTPAQAGTAR